MTDRIQEFLRNRRSEGLDTEPCLVVDLEIVRDNYQTFAKAVRVEDYSRVMGDMRPNNARLKRVSEYASRDLTDATEIGVTRLGQLIIALQQLLKDTEAQVIVEQLRSEMADFLEARSLLVDMLAFIERKAPESEVRSAAEVLGARLKNLRFGD